MKILVTGAKGFIGKNLIEELRNQGYSDIYEYDKESGETDLLGYCKDCEFVFHLAGVNRPKDVSEFMEGNASLTGKLIECLRINHNNSPIVLSSSIQARLDNPYGISKRAGEELLLSYGKEMQVPIMIYRFPNVFGKWCRPNYNSVIATFCYQLARGLPIMVNDKASIMQLVYIDDVVKELLTALNLKPTRGEEGYCIVPVVHTASVGEIAELIYSFRESRENFFVPDMSDELIKKLYSTYLSYLPKDAFKYPLHMNVDERGSFTEFIKTKNNGQVSVNVSKPGVVKGNHWHHTKNEKFLVVSGEALIQFQQVGSDEIIEYRVSGERLEVVDIPVGYSHNIVNVGSMDLVTLMWANELFDEEAADTFWLEVGGKKI